MDEVAKLKRQRIWVGIAAAIVIAAGLAGLRLLSPGDPAPIAFYVAVWAVAQIAATLAVFFAYDRAIVAADRLRDVEALAALGEPLHGIAAVTEKFGEIVRSRTGLRLVASLLAVDQSTSDAEAGGAAGDLPAALANSAGLSTSHLRAVGGLMERRAVKSLDVDTPLVLERGSLEPLEAEALDSLGGGVFVLVPMVLGGRVQGAACFAGESDRDVAGVKGTLVCALGRHVAAASWTHGLMRRIEEVDRRIQEVDRLRAAERATVEDLESKSGFNSGLVYNLSHEMRTTLATVKAATELLGEEDGMEPGGERFQFLLGTIARNVARQETLVSNILDMASIENEALVLNPERLDVRSFVAEVADTVAPLFEERRQVLTLRLPKHLPAITADGARLSQVLVNLLANARNHSPEGAETVLSAEVRQDRLVFAVCDSGPGVPEAERERVFEAFYRKTNGGAVAPGTGLGLAIAKSLVELHRGSIWIEESPTAGAAFMFSLPV